MQDKYHKKDKHKQNDVTYKFAGIDEKLTIYWILYTCLQYYEHLFNHPWEMVFNCSKF